MPHLTKLLQVHVQVEVDVTELEAMPGAVDVQHLTTEIQNRTNPHILCKTKHLHVVDKVLPTEV
jgi:hypothetical protein